MFAKITRSSRYTCIAIMGGAVLLASVAQPANAATTTANMSVDATVTSNCAVSASPIAFGNVNVTSGSNADATGGISVTCTSGTAWAAAADAGLGSGATLSLRKMDDGSNLLNYALYTDSGRTTLWGDGAGGTTATVSDTGTGAAQAKTIYGRVPSGQSGVPAGDYADTVTVTVTY
jgi:spore coat protein U-like protein